MAECYHLNSSFMLSLPSLTQLTRLDLGDFELESGPGSIGAPFHGFNDFEDNDFEDDDFEDDDFDDEDDGVWETDDEDGDANSDGIHFLEMDSAEGSFEDSDSDASYPYGSEDCRAPKKREQQLERLSTLKALTAGLSKHLHVPAWCRTVPSDTHHPCRAASQK